MKNVHKSVLIWYSPEEMFALVTGVDKYPEFLPWCDRAAVLEADAGGMTAEVGIAFAGLRQTFTTRNTTFRGARWS
jgi:ribosome-associated toxin RatA of RatAB toxin-antitoxin module